MRKVKFGQSDLQVSPISFGGNVFGWTLDENKSFEILDALVASGINFIDTADTYSTWAPGNQGGESENIIGKWMKERGNRKDLVVDRKSTRLNFSHVKISYAVFCLKKKKNI